MPSVVDQAHNNMLNFIESCQLTLPKKNNFNSIKELILNDEMYQWLMRVESWGYYQIVKDVLDMAKVEMKKAQVI